MLYSNKTYDKTHVNIIFSRGLSVKTDHKKRDSAPQDYFRSPSGDSNQREGKRRPSNTTVDDKVCMGGLRQNREHVATPAERVGVLCQVRR